MPRSTTTKQPPERQDSANLELWNFADLYSAIRAALRLVSDARASKALPLWYRGIGNGTNHRLIPTLYRHPTLVGAPQLLRLEADLMRRFRQRSLPFLDPGRQNLDPWGCLFLMQHYGVPTRLLDWSENALIALFFALTSASRDSTWAVTHDAAVWVLCPSRWNEKALESITYGAGIADPSDDKIKAYTPGAYIGGGGFDPPVALYGNHNSPRIVAQRGTFTVFGRSTKTMEAQFEDDGFPPDALSCIQIPAASVDALLSMVIDTGYVDSMLFPDLDGLARELKRQFGFRS